MTKIVITGGSGRFGKELKKYKSKHRIFFPEKKDLDILDIKKIRKYLQKKKPKILVHLAGLSRPLDVHEKQIERSIDLNIIGTANITKICKELNIKLIYFSTNYVYPGKTGNYKETYPIFLTLCTLGITMGIPLQHAALIWLWSRFIHAPSYIFNWKWIRTLSWHMSLLCLITMIFQIIFLNRLTMFTHF